ncbi:fibronectin type III domain-containing protein [Candidatus Manganitrophus noduliformans]|uniref:DNRLRE domain-containing protein n=1 Tax=Candidatus Manganitrophus noduliformans TaxID=2606439 RepID=A0A7X6DQ87_9BACT|nr:DNRLRE domain-containing protein [Candidatus Manganitrophus noduliformans]NKE71371.1 DNRLRE domain-containing protein [Candidatus Manganitrophus noduliformans]
MSDAKKVGLIFGVFIFSFLFFSMTVFAGDATLTWSANAESDLAGYRVYFGTASRTYGPSINVGKTTSYTLTGLANQTYFFAVTAYDTAGNESSFSAEVTKTLTTPDTLAPVISSINAGSVTGNSAVITWGTNEPTDTQIQYGTTTAYGSSTARVATLVTVHSQTLTGLQPQTLYHYRVLSRDAAGNLATSLDNTFTTAAPLPPPTSTPTTVRLSPAADTFININTSVYNTSTTLNTYTFPANQTANAVLMKFALSSLPAGVVIQSATLNLSLVESDATADATYSVAVHKLINRNPDLTLATGMTYDGTNAWTANSCCRNNYPLAQADISAAYDTELINKTLGNKVWDITAMVREWMSSPSSNFGLLVNSDASKGADRYRFFASMEHPTATLRPYLSITYSASTADTSAPTAPTGLTATAASSSQINLSWNASTDNVGVTGYRIYRNGTQVGTTTLRNYSNAGLAADTAYSYTVAAYDEAGNLSAQSAAVSTRTLPPPDTTAPVISGIVAGSITANGALISWTTNEPADTQVEYGTTTAYGASTAIVSTLLTAHSQILTGLNPATTYQYRVKSKDAAGNLATSGNGTFTTVALPDTTAPSIPGNLLASVLSAVQINLTWNASTDNVGVAGYRVYRNGVQVGTTTSRTYSDTGLFAATLYSYRVAAYDAAGNVSAQSAAINATTLVSNPPPTSTPTTVRLSPAADTFININTSVYNTSTTLNTYTFPANQTANAVLMKFALSSLPAGVVIQSATLNLSLVESDATADATYSVAVHKLINRNPDLTLATGMTYDGTNAWTANSCCRNNYPLAQADISAAYDTELINKTLGNKVWDITAMVREWMSSPSSNFGLLVNSDASKGADRYRFFASMEHPTATLRPYLSITYAAADTTAPVISGMAAGGITSNGATITWTTNEASDTQVEYGTTTAYGASTAIVSTLLTAHSQILTGLNPATTYQYRVKSKDAAGNLAASGNGTFTTAPLPDTTAPSVPQGLLANILSAVQINLTWSASTDNVGVAGYRVYRNGVQVGTTATPGYSDTGLLAATLYSYRVAAYDAAGNVSAQSPAISATTLLLNPSTQVRLNPVADTFLNLNSTVYSGSTTLNTYTFPANQTANAVLMKFALSGIPAGAVIQSATLNLSLVESDATADATYSVAVHKLINRNPDLTLATGMTYDGTNAWTANSCCRNNYPLAQADISAAYDTELINKTLGNKVWDITAMVREWMSSPSSNFGLLVNSDASKGADRYRFFASMEHPTATLRPYLSVTYTLP